MREWGKERQECEKGGEGKRVRDTSIDFQCHLVVVSRGDITVVGWSRWRRTAWQLSPEKRRTTLFFLRNKPPLPRSARASCLLMPLIDCPPVNSYRFNVWFFCSFLLLSRNRASSCSMINDEEIRLSGNNSRLELSRFPILSFLFGICEWLD